MLNYIWAFMILISIVLGVFNGRLSEVTLSAFEGANNAISVILSFAGVTAMWSGFMKVAERCDVIKVMTKLIRPLCKIIFPKLKKETTALELVSANMIANMLGLSNAATPFGIKAMQELDRINGYKNTASDSMCMFAIINSASIQIIPSTMIGIRASMGSATPSDIVVPVWIVSILSAFCAILTAKLFASVTISRRHL